MSRIKGGGGALVGHMKQASPDCLPKVWARFASAQNNWLYRATLAEASQLPQRGGSGKLWPPSTKKKLQSAYK